MLPNGNPIQIGDAQPGYEVGWNNSFTYKAFRLAGLWDWERGNMVRNNEDAYFAFGPDLWGDSVRSARFAQQTEANLTPREQNASYLKLRSLALTYTVPDRWVTKIPGNLFSSARIGLTGRDLLLFWTKSYDGMDPEGSSQRESKRHSRRSGYAISTVPQLLPLRRPGLLTCVRHRYLRRGSHRAARADARVAGGLAQS